MSSILVDGTTSTVNSPTDNSYTVESGGVLDVVDGGSVAGLITVSNGGMVIADIDGSTLDTVVSSGGSATVSNGGSATSTTILTSGSATVSAGGYATSTTVSAGGKEVLFGSETDGAVTSGGSLVVFAGGVSIDETVSTTGYTATSATEVLSGGTASGTMLSGTGKLLVRNGGTAVGTVVSNTHFGMGSNGGINVSAGGTASGTILDSGGYQFVSASANAIDTVVNSGGIDFVYTGGTDTSATVNDDGSLQVSGGTATSATIDANSVAMVFAGGVASATTIDGGALNLQAGGSATGTVTFEGAGGTLVVNGTTMPTATIDGFAVAGSTIDLAGVDYSAGVSEQLVGDNKLEISQNGVANPYILQLDPNQDFSGDTFLLNPDSGTGTAVTLASDTPSLGTYVYYVNGSESEPLGLLRVEQGAGGSWSAPVSVTIDGVIDSNAVDPSMTVLANGEYLLTYDNFSNGSTPNYIYTAISTDGVNFTDNELAFTPPANTYWYDPTAIQLTNGSFLMAVTENGSTVEIYTSADGRSYTPTGVSVPGAFSTQLALLSDGDVRLFSNGPGGITSYISTDQGQTWTEESGVRLAGAYSNPTVLQTGPDQWEMIVNSLITPEQNAGPSDQQFSLATSTDGYNFTISQSDFLEQASVPTLAADPPFIVVADGATDVGSATTDTYEVGTAGTLTIENGGSVTGTTILSDGLEIVDAGGVTSGTQIAGGTLEVVAGGSVGTSVDFATGSGGTLQIDGAQTPGDVVLGGATLSGFAVGDTIDLTGVAYQADHSAHMVAGDRLDLNVGGNDYYLQLSGDYSGAHFVVSPDGVGPDAGTDVTIACYCRGTRIATEQGDKPVETLEIGDLVMTRSGQTRPIKWIGRRSYAGRFANSSKAVLPVCIKAGALDDQVPRRDLWVSPSHAMYFCEMYFGDMCCDGVLIEAKDLVNGVSIVQAERVERIDYFHIELDSHDVVVAEGALSETYIDDDNRAMFHNASDHAARFSHAVAAPARYCAPRCDQGDRLEAVRRRIASRAGLKLRPTAA